MSTVHVVPLRDLIEHNVPGGLDGHDVLVLETGRWLTIEAHGDDVTCPCGPFVEHVPHWGPDGWVVVHHSLDGREHREPRR